MEESLVATSVRRIYTDESTYRNLRSRKIPIPGNGSGVKEPILLAFGEPIPASAVAAMAETNGIPCPDDKVDRKSIERYESETWNCLRQVIDKLVESADSTNLKRVVARLFAENIVRGRCLFASACMRCQSKNPDLTPVYAALVGFVDTHFPAVGDILYRRLWFTISQMLTQKYDEEMMEATTKFLAHLVNLDVVSVGAPIELISRCLEQKTKLAVTLLKELRIPRHIMGFGDVHRQFTRMKGARTLKKEIRDMAAFIVAEENWNRIFEGNSIVPSELHWVIPLLNPRYYHCEVKKPTTNQNIFLDVYKPDKNILKQERAYNLFRSMILCGGYWESFPLLPLKEREHLSRFDEAAGTFGTEDQQSVFRRLLPIIRSQDEAQVLLEIIKYSCSEGRVSRFVPLIEFLCNQDKDVYMEALETCFLVMWLMVAGATRFATYVAIIFAQLLHRGWLSWDVVAGLSFEPQDMNLYQYDFLKVLFWECAYGNGDSIAEKVFCADCPCIWAKITFFKTINFVGVAADLEKLLKEKKGTKVKNVKRTREFFVENAGTKRK